MEALLQAGFMDSHVEQAVNAGILNLDYLDRYYLQPAPQSGHSFAEFMDALWPRGAILPNVYETLGFAAPDPSTPIRTDEQQLLSEFLSGWSV